MNAIGTEALPLFGRPHSLTCRSFREDPNADHLPGLCNCGAKLRDAALSQHQQNHKDDIAKVRIALLVAAEMGNLSHLTGDDVMAVVEQMGIPGDPRWTATVLKGWDRVQPTDQFVPSQRPKRHCAPLRVWRLLPQEGV